MANNEVLEQNKASEDQHEKHENKMESFAASVWANKAPDATTNRDNKPTSSLPELTLTNSKDGNHEGEHVALTKTDAPPPAALDANATRVSDALTGIFRVEHPNRTGTMTPTEINRLMQNPNLSDDQAVMLAAVRSNFDAVRALDPGQAGITNAAMLRLQDAWSRHINGQPITAAQTELVTSMQSSVRTYQGYLDGANRNLFATATPRDSVVPDAATQGTGVGNCHFVSGMTSLARTNPQAIVDMITTNNNGTYTVRFPGQDPITVNRPTNAELAYYGTANQHGTWSTVLQMAYGRLWSPSATGTPAIEGAGGSMRSDGLRTLTGVGMTTTHTGRFTNWSTMHTELQRVNTEPTTATVFSEVGEVFGGSPSTGFTGGHEYAVIGFTPNNANHQAARVTIQNPHRSMSWPNGTVPTGMVDHGDGRVEMSLAQFNSIFYNYSTARPRR